MVYCVSLYLWLIDKGYGIPFERDQGLSDPVEPPLRLPRPSGVELLPAR